MAAKTFLVEDLTNWTIEILQLAGLAREAAETTADALVDADLKGLDSHGVSRLPVYVKNVRSGRFRAGDSWTIRTSGAIGVVDGGYGIGPVVAKRAMEAALDLASQYGVGAVAVRNGNHFGAAAYYARMAVDRRMVGMVLTNTPSAMPPTGGKRPFFGTNPLAFSFPAAGDPIEIDMSTSVTARGKIIQAAKAGQAIPDDWAVDEDGHPTTDAVKALAGSLLPIGGAKGYALALAVEILCSVLTGSVWGPHIGWMYDDQVEPIRMGHFMLAIDVARFVEWEVYLHRMDEFREEIKSAEKASWTAEILIPGERRARLASHRLVHGIPLPEATVAQLHELAATMGWPRLGNEPLQG
ncbi:MAG: Ldh family oxidoreductase [Bacilli bacterium]